MALISSRSVRTSIVSNQLSNSSWPIRTASGLPLRVMMYRARSFLTLSTRSGRFWRASEIGRVLVIEFSFASLCCLSYSILYNHKVNVNRFNSLSLSLTRSKPVCAVHASGSGWCAEDVVQRALEAEPIRPAPQVIEIETRGLPVDDAPGIDEIMIPAGFELQEDQVFGGRHPDRQSFDGQ